jgi:alcohol dehydrogenase class IV
MLAAFVADLPGFDVGVYSDIVGNPVASQVTRGAAAYKAHRADAVIGLGGGAALDVAKAIALMATHEGDVLEYAWDHPKVRAIERALPWFVALPTTAGTGSRSALERRVRRYDAHQEDHFLAEAAGQGGLRRPELTLDLPPHITAATGMDADPQRRVVPVPRVPSVVRRHRSKARGSPPALRRRCASRTACRRAPT